MGSSYEFRIHPGAAGDLKSAPADVRERIRKKLREMVTNEFRDLMDYDVKKLRGTRNDLYRTRIGGYRVAFVVSGDVVGIVGADKRSGAYGNVDTFDDRADEFSG
jgi:mRNA-degrading endonuclease RelE of RelBE toxin-antitoxin system